MKKAAKEVSQERVDEVLKNQLVSLDDMDYRESNDYYSKEEIGFKKPKKKKRSRKREADEADVADGDVEMGEAEDVKPKAKLELDRNYVDDDDLQASLARARQLAAEGEP